jgi:uncharacterized protein YkwD
MEKVPDHPERPRSRVSRRLAAALAIPALLAIGILPLFASGPVSAERLVREAAIRFLRGSPGSTIRSSGGAIPPPSKVETALFHLINSERSRRGLPPLHLSADLARLAREHSAEMAASGNLIHDSAGGKPLHDRLTGASLSFTADAENIARIDHCDPARLHRSFMGSPSHRGNILDPRFDEVGIGVAFGGGNVCYVTEDFIRTAPGSGPGPDGLSPRPGT